MRRIIIYITQCLHTLNSAGLADFINLLNLVNLLIISWFLLFNVSRFLNLWNKNYNQSIQLEWNLLCPIRELTALNINHLLLTRILENILTKFNLEVYGLGGISWFAVFLEAPEHNGALRFNPGATPLPSTHPGE